jgi:hypothetical protein
MTRRAGLLQLDLFGEAEQVEAAAADLVQARADWVARFERAVWIAPWNTAGGMKAGDLGWKCPDCGAVEPNEFLLGNNHGWHVDQPGWIPYAQNYDGRCTRLRLLDAHRVYDERRAMIRHLTAEGMTDEQIAAQVGFWNASTIAGYRKEDAKAARLAARAAKGEIVRVGHGSDCPCAYCDGPCTCPSCESFRGGTTDTTGGHDA